jgi:hypothetical protein
MAEYRAVYVDYLTDDGTPRIMEALAEALGDHEPTEHLSVAMGMNFAAILIWERPT